MTQANQNDAPLQVVFENRMEAAVTAGIEDVGIRYVAAYTAGMLVAVLDGEADDLRREVVEYLRKEIGL